MAEDGLAAEITDPRSEAVVARVCGMEDFNALAAAVREKASRAVADIDALHGAVPSR